jgi:hypothetical protein
MKTITRGRLARRPVPEGPAESVRGSSIEEVIGRASTTGEHVVEFAEALRQTSDEEFVSAAVAVTDQRVLVVAAVGGEFEVSFAAARGDCWVISSKGMPDGSTLLILGSDDGYQCLAFKPEWKPEADTIITRLAEGLEKAEEASAETEPLTNDIDRFELSLEFAGLFVEPEQEEED